jgi:hypothetical protein
MTFPFSSASISVIGSKMVFIQVLPVPGRLQIGWGRRRRLRQTWEESPLTACPGLRTISLGSFQELSGNVIEGRD